MVENPETDSKTESVKLGKWGEKFGAWRRQQLDGFRLLLAKSRDRKDVARTNELEDPVHGGDAGTETGVDAQTLGHGEILQAIDQSDRLAGPQPLGKERGDDVDLGFGGEGKVGIDLLDGVLRQDPLVGPVPMNDDRAFDPRRELPASLRIPFEELDPDSLPLQPAGRFDPQLPAAHDEDPLHLLGKLDSHEPEDRLRLGGRTHDMDVVSRLESGPFSGYQGPASPKDDRHQRVLGRRTPIQFGHAPAHDPVVRFYVHPEEPHPAFCEFQHVGDARQSDHAKNAIRRLAVGIDDQVHLHAGAVEDLLPAIGLVAPEAGHLDPDVGVPFGDQAPENVDFVTAGNGDQHFGFADAGPFQNPDAAVAALNDLGVQTLFQQLAAVPPLLDDDDLVALLDETARHQPTAPPPSTRILIGFGKLTDWT